MVPNPARDVFHGWDLKTFDLVQVPVIQFVPDWCQNFIDLSQVQDPSGLRIRFTADEDLDQERVAVNVRVGMIRLDIRSELMRRLEGKLFE